MIANLNLLINKGFPIIPIRHKISSEVAPVVATGEHFYNSYCYFL